MDKDEIKLKENEKKTFETVFSGFELQLCSFGCAFDTSSKICLTSDPLGVILSKNHCAHS